ncbi:hypothetical protein SeMB42_g01587 [Synchytrium endobioticum]|uniref:Protein-serine/threonine kinase n=1 Tax=Synchytrium endobioticum TaxID=286115 RepID=A0A507DKL0_9FUNG|nr:hypothetical protein SeMB42_g01587 [Synchytrium endobioticum]
MPATVYKSTTFTNDRPPPSSTKASNKPHHLYRHNEQTTQHHPSFYHNRVLDRYVAQEAKRVTLRQLTVFGRTLTADKLLRSANYVRHELAPMFCATVQSQLKEHLVAIPQLAMGIAESSQHFPDGRVSDRFMNEMLRSRIGRRVLAEQHITLSAVYDGARPEQAGFIGIVDTNVNAGRTVSKCAILARELFAEAFHIVPPSIEIDGAVAATFTYVPDHVEYIMYEILKNAVRGTVEALAPRGIVEAAYARVMGESSAGSHGGRTQHHIVPNRSAEVGGLEGMRGGTGTVVKGSAGVQQELDGPSSSRSPLDEDDHDASLYGHIHPGERQQQRAQLDTRIDLPCRYASLNPPLPGIRVTIGASSTSLTFRISDQAGGIPKSLLSHVWSYTSASKSRLLNFNQVPQWAAKMGEKTPTLLHLGLGLPMSRVYANYWGGDVTIQTMDGYGTDVYVKIYTGNSLEVL